MHDHDLTDAAIEALIDGQPTPGTPGVMADLVTELRVEYLATPEVQASPALAAFMAVVDLTDTPQAEHLGPTRRTKMISGISAFVATTTGKILLGTAVAAASIGGGQAARLIDVPGLPDASPAIAVVEIETVDPAVADTETTEADAVVEADDSAVSHGQQVSDFVHTTDLEGCEKGQATAAIASSKASDHRQNPERAKDPCDKTEVDTDGTDSVESEVDDSKAPAAAPATDEKRGDSSDDQADESDHDAAKPERSGRVERSGKPDESGKAGRSGGDD